MLTPVETLRSSLEKHNDAFESLLKLIPAKFYIPQDNNDQVARSCLRPELSFTQSQRVSQVSSKYHKHSKKARAPKQIVKEASKKARKEKVRVCRVGCWLRVEVTSFFFFFG